jgi:phage major head subunit gpT-like protein
MIVRTDIPKLLLAGMKTEFMGAYEKATKEHMRITTRITSSKEQETYPWLGGVPSMSEWKDERKPQGVLEHNFSVVNRDWEASIAVDRNALEDEQYGQINIRVRELATEAVRFFDELVFTLIDQGDGTSGSGIFSGVTISCYDSKAFFATNHTEGSSGTQSNKGSTALGDSALRAAITAMRKFKQDTGKFSHMRPNLLAVSPDLEWQARELLESQYYPEEGTTTNKFATNVLKGSLDLLVSEYLTDTNDWFIFDTTRVVKPVILQVRKTPDFTNLTNNTESSFMRKKLYFGIDWRGESAFGDWRTGYGSIVT